MLTDPSIRAAVPPWGGELGIDLLHLLDFDAIGAAEPTWLVGLSDTTTVMVPLTLLTGWATLHGENLMDTPYAVHPSLESWWAVAGCTEGSPSPRARPGCTGPAGSTTGRPTPPSRTGSSWKVPDGSCSTQVQDRWTSPDA